jgi:geranylgeranyl transferase type-1 subunit beta
MEGNCIHLQSFSASIKGAERDMRFLFCAFAISYILGNWSGINRPLSYEFIKSSRNYDGAYGVGPCKESHGGSTYCVVTSLALAGELEILQNEKLVYWLISRQDVGFHGRLNKPDDTCYGFWIGSCLDVRVFG